MTELGMKVKIELIKRNMSQQELAKSLKTSKQNLNGVLNGRSSSLHIEEQLWVWLRQPRFKVRTSGKYAISHRRK